MIEAFGMCNGDRAVDNVLRSCEDSLVIRGIGPRYVDIDYYYQSQYRETVKRKKSRTVQRALASKSKWITAVLGKVIGHISSDELKDDRRPNACDIFDSIDFIHVDSDHVGH
jgi:hypothetical protein